MSSNIVRTSTTIVGTAVVTVATAAASIWIGKSLSRYGLNGTLRYIWEGDPYPPDVRDAITRLDTVELLAMEQESLLELLEESLQRAKLDSVEDYNIIEPQWIIAHAPRDLEKDLAKVSHELDMLAAKVDAVPSHGNVDLKRRKKSCSQQAVLMMEQADALLALYNQDHNIVVK